MTYFTPITPEKAQEWIDELPKHKKGKVKLCDERGRMCCLGVKAEMEGRFDGVDDLGNKTVLGNGAFLDPTTLDSWGLSFRQADVLADLNDRSDTWKPVQDEIRRMFIDGATT